MKLLRFCLGFYPLDGTHPSTKRLTMTGNTQIPSPKSNKAQTLSNLVHIIAWTENNPVFTLRIIRSAIDQAQR